MDRPGPRLRRARRPHPARPRGLRPRRRAGRRLLAAGAVLAVALTTAPAPVTAQPAAPPPAPMVAAGDRTVTLITGDRVTLLPDGSLAVTPGPDRDSMIFERYKYGEHRYVIPVDAADLVDQGRLDRRLFDVAGLLADGYGDADRPDLPLLMAPAGGTAPAALAAGPVRVTRELPALGITAARVAKRDAGALWAQVRPGRAAGTAALARGIGTIWLDGQRELALDESVPRVGAPTAWQAGFTGAGVTVAVLDSGIDLTHPDVAGNVVDVRNFTEAPDGNDTQGHGTHVASILAGTGEASGGQFRGVAPDASLLIGKVCPDRSCPESAILAGMEWAATEQGAAVVNMSLGQRDTPELDLLEEAVNRLTAETGALFVTSAGNNGNQQQPVSSPASADAALAVGAVDRFDFLADFSSRGPRVGDTALKPDLTAPGVGIAAARAADGSIGDPIDQDYTRLDGTSMASPHVAGAAAILSQQHPEWTAAQLKAALIGSATPHPSFTAFEQGAGRLDVATATGLSVLADPPSISLGRHPFPQDGGPVERTVTYHNHGTEDVPLNLFVNVRGPSGLPAPFGMFTVAPGTVTVPAGGEATATLTADTGVPSGFGHFTGAVVATGAGPAVRTPVAVDKESERMELTLTHLDRDGAPAPSYTTTVMSLDTGVVERTAQEPDGTVTLRLPPGPYMVHSHVRTRADGQVDSVTSLAHSLLDLSDHTSVMLDARAGEPTRVAVPRRSARPAFGMVQYSRLSPFRAFDGIILAPDLSFAFTADIGPEVPGDQVIAAVHSQWAEPGPDRDFRASPYVYHLAWFQQGRFWTGFDEVVRPGDLAMVRTAYRSHAPDRIGRQTSTGRPLSGNPSGGFGFEFPLPFTRTEYYLAGDRTWFSTLDTVDPRRGDPLLGLTETTQNSGLRTFARSGGDRPETWGRGVFGPAFPFSDSIAGTQWIYRQSGGLPTIAGDPGAGVLQGNDSLALSTSLFATFLPGKTAFSREDRGRLALYRDGELVGEVPSSRQAEFPVPDEESTYRIEAEAARAGFAEVSTEVRAAWTVRSAHVPGTEFVNLPVMTVRFAPSLDAQQQAPAGRAFLLPVSVERQALSPDPAIASLQVEVSYDDGATWQPATAVGDDPVPSRYRLDHPRDASYVSLRAAAVDVEGNAVEQTIIRAYRLS